jgi:hypothetical protein
MYVVVVVVVCMYVGWKKAWACRLRWALRLVVCMYVCLRSFLHLLSVLLEEGMSMPPEMNTKVGSVYVCMYVCMYVVVVCVYVGWRRAWACRLKWALRLVDSVYVCMFTKSFLYLFVRFAGNCIWACRLSWFWRFVCAQCGYFEHTHTCIHSVVIYTQSFSSCLVHMCMLSALTHTFYTFWV